MTASEIIPSQSTLIQCNEWPFDAFDDKPMRYIKASDKKFYIYSIGPDLEDNKAEKLPDSGRIWIYAPHLDIGFQISIE